MPGPAAPPIGLQLTRTAKVVGRAFDEALTAAGGSLPTWLILISLTAGRADTQRELAESVGIRGATLTHHLAAMERDGLVTRHRDPGNRRVQQVQLTDAGHASFVRMRKAAMAFDTRLRSGLSTDDVAALGRLLDRLQTNVSDDPSANGHR